MLLNRCTIAAACTDAAKSSMMMVERWRLAMAVAMPTAEELLLMQSHHSCRCRLDQAHLMTRAESRVSGS